MGPLRTFTDWLRTGFTPAPPPPGTPSADKSTPDKPQLVGTAITIKGPDGTLIHCRGMPELVYPGETNRPQAPATPPVLERPQPHDPYGLFEERPPEFLAKGNGGTKKAQEKNPKSNQNGD